MSDLYEFLFGIAYFGFWIVVLIVAIHFVIKLW